ncbi:MAG TPA: hypothetical protein VFU23_00905 [Gemmatimonadales bacterium]|nr:hypothetical protein [Gemmatimonadales bacterium]
MHTRGTAILIIGCLASCGVTPLTNKLRIGEESYIIAVGEGNDGQTDLYAAPAGGGSFTRLTFSRPEEALPAISPDGARVAFLRAAGGVKGPPWSVVVLDLMNYSERVTPLPSDAGDPRRLGWTRDGARVIVSAREYFVTSAAPAPPALTRWPADSTALADSLTRQLLGDPPLGMVGECSGGGLCIVARTGEVTPLDSGARDAVRWGADSVGYFLPGGFEIRPLAGGSTRRPAWSGAPARLRQLSYYRGPQDTTSSGVSGIR